MLSCKANNELINLVQKFKKSKDIAIAKQIVEIYESIPEKSKTLGNNFHVIASIVHQCRKKLNESISKQTLEILNLISSYRKSKSKDIAESILNYYDSIDNRKEIFGMHFRKIQTFICRLRKKFSVNSNPDNEVKKRIISLIKEFKITRSLDTAREICEVYDSITDSKSKILGQDYGRIKLFVWNIKKKFFSNNPELIDQYEKNEREKLITLTQYEVKTLSPGRTNSVINLSYRLQKFQIRRYLLDLVKDKYLVEALTLPGTEWIFERDLLIQHQNDCIIVGLENDRTVYNYSRLNMPPSDLVYYFNISDREFFSKQSHPFCFDLIWLDYMGPFTRQRLEVFELACKNGYLKSDCIVALTFMCGREFKDIQDEYRKSCGNKDNFHEARKRVIPEMYCRVAQSYGYETEIKKVEIYREQQGNCNSVPMIFIALALTKK